MTFVVGKLYSSIFHRHHLEPFGCSPIFFDRSLSGRAVPLPWRLVFMTPVRIENWDDMERFLQQASFLPLGYNQQDCILLNNNMIGLDTNGFRQFLMFQQILMFSWNTPDLAINQRDFCFQTKRLVSGHRIRNLECRAGLPGGYLQKFTQHPWGARGLPRIARAWIFAGKNRGIGYPVYGRVSYVLKEKNGWNWNLTWRDWFHKWRLETG